MPEKRAVTTSDASATALAETVTPPTGITPRAIVAGLILTPLSVVFVVHASMLQGGFRFTGRHSLFVNAVAALFVLALVNCLLRRYRPRWTFGSGEMLTVYLMLGVSTGLISSAFDLGGSLSGIVTYPFWFATDENRWSKALWDILPQWLTVREPAALAKFYIGGANPYSWEAFRPWLTPALWYSAFMAAVMWVCLCLTSIIRRRWEDEERLPFPIAVLPLQLSEPNPSLFRAKLWWIGVGVAVAAGTWNTLAPLFPSLPALPVGIDYSPYVANRFPWGALRFQRLEWQPFTVGLCYLVPLELAFSLWVFGVFWQAEYVLSNLFGWSTGGWHGFPYGDQQSGGGYFALLIAALWLERHYLVQVARRVLGMPSNLREDGEAFTYRGAVIGMVPALLFLWWFLQRGGMQSWVAFSFLGIYIPMMLVISRLRAQLGPPTHNVQFTTPNLVLPTLVGTRTLGRRTMGMFTMLSPFLMSQRNNPIPLQAEGFRMSSGGRMDRRRLALVLALVAPITIFVYFWASMKVCYQAGLGSTIGYYPYLHVPRRNVVALHEAAQFPSGPDLSVSLAMGVGLVLTLGLMWLKLRFYWWPLHPVAFPIATALESLTPTILVTWLIKAMVLRYGGLRAHRAVLPFFLGLLAGGAMEAVLRRCLSLLLGVDLSYMAT